MKIISKKEFDSIGSDYTDIFHNYRGDHPEWKGRRTAFLPGEGTTLSIEGVHFLVDGDYSHLPVLHKRNARVGDCYKFAGGYIEVTKVYRISEQYAREYELIHLDRVDYIQHAAWGAIEGSSALPGSDILK